MQINKIPHNIELDKNFIKFLNRLDIKGILSGSQKKIMRDRESRIQNIRNGISKLPTWMEDQTSNNEWDAKVPIWIQDQRNQMTGPADDIELVVKLINSGSPGVMLDLEDSLANTPESLLAGHNNIKKALIKRLSYDDKNGSTIPVGFGAKYNPDTVIFTRVRGLHMQQQYPGKIRNFNTTSASLFDLAYHFYDMELEKLSHPPCIYIPKSEGAHEANWWHKAFEKIEKLKKWSRGTIKCMALVESHPMAYEMEEFAFNLQPYLVGLNLGRWDYMASLIDFMYKSPDWLFPDRNTIPTDIPFFQNLRHWMAHVCHKHGILAIGGMTALYPSRKDKKLNRRALKVLKIDKENEASCLMDGAWTGHPDQNKVAVNAFPHPNQIHKMPGLTKLPDLREFPNKNPHITEEGTREAISTCIQYRQSVLEGKGAKLINGYMEDLATDRIYRIMICQRIDQGVHTETEVMKMFIDETGKLIEKYPGINWLKGRDATVWLIRDRQFNPR